MTDPAPGRTTPAANVRAGDVIELLGHRWTIRRVTRAGENYWCSECVQPWANRQSSKDVDTCPECGTTNNKPRRSEDLDEIGIMMRRSCD